MNCACTVRADGEQSASWGFPNLSQMFKNKCCLRRCALLRRRLSHSELATPARKPHAHKDKWNPPPVKLASASATVSSSSAERLLRCTNSCCLVRRLLSNSAKFAIMISQRVLPKPQRAISSQRTLADNIRINPLRNALPCSA